MTLLDELESLIRQSVRLGRANGAGFEPCKCASCSDYKERGAFKFDGSKIGFACFNCGLKTVFDPSSTKRPSKKFSDLLTACGIPEDAQKALVTKYLLASGSLTAKPQDAKEAAAKLAEYAPPKPIDPPPNMLPLTADSPWCEVAEAYLESRGLNPSSYTFYVSDSRIYEGRLIIPFYYKDQLVYWQARSMDDTYYHPRYKNPQADKSKIIFNYEELANGSSVEPLFITEGAIDAISIGKRASALNGSTISGWQDAELKKVARRGRKLIFVIDKNENGYNLGMKALLEGWHVTVLPDGVDDANKGLVRFGKLWLLNHLASTAVTGLAGKLLLAAKCERENNDDTR